MKTIILHGFVLAAAGCHKGNAMHVPADDTRVNEHDQNTAALTPTDHGENEIDRTIPRKIRHGGVWP